MAAKQMTAPFKSIKNTLDGKKDFDRLACTPSRSPEMETIALDSDDKDSEVCEVDDSDWELVDVRKGEESSEVGYKIDDDDQTFTHQALSYAAERVGCTVPYAATEASRYISMLLARDLGSALSSLTAAEVVKQVQGHFPLLENLKKAFMEMGRKSGGERNSKGRNSSPREFKVGASLEEWAIMGGGDGGLGEGVAFRDGKVLGSGGDIELRGEEEEEGRGRKAER